MVRLADAARTIPSVARLLDSVEGDTMLRFRPPAGRAVGPAEYLGGGTPVEHSSSSHKGEVHLPVSLLYLNPCGAPRSSYKNGYLSLRHVSKLDRLLKITGGCGAFSYELIR